MAVKANFLIVYLFLSTHTSFEDIFAVIVQILNQLFIIDDIWHVLA